jgi:hypothetical protein
VRQKEDRESVTSLKQPKAMRKDSEEVEEVLTVIIIYALGVDLIHDQLKILLFRKFGEREEGREGICPSERIVRVGDDLVCQLRSW